MIRFLPCIVIPLGIASAEVDGVADPFANLPQNRTVIWSPLFQATWDTMNQHMGGKPKRIEPPNELMSRLDSFRWKAKDIMPDGCWKTWAGPATTEFLNTVNKEAAQMTGEAKGPFSLENPSPNNIAAFGLLDRVVEFKKSFSKSLTQPLLFGEHKNPVQFFGVRGEATQTYSTSTRVLAYRPKDGSHALEVSCKGSDDTLILYLPAKAQNFATACEWIRKWRTDHSGHKGHYGKWNDGYLHEQDDVRIPYISLTAKTEFADQLKSGRYYGMPGDPWLILRAEQKTKFILSEKGAETRIESSIEAGPFADAPERDSITPRNFIYDHPFFVFLWRKNADWPYLSAWIGDSSALVPK